MRSGFALALGFALVLPASSAQADVRVTMKDGLVTLTATGATVREIMAEWARVGQTRIVNAERISGAPITMQLTGVPEAQALDIVLRSVSGYLAAPRAEANPSLSRFDRILVLPTSTPPRNAPAPAPTFQPPPFQPANDDDPVDRPVPPGGPSPANPVFNSFPQPGAPPPQGEPPPAPPPGFGPPGTQPFGQTPMGVTVPGMVVPTPTQSGQYPPTRPPDQDRR